MNQTTSEQLRAYFKRVQGACPALFNMAHAICGNYDLAEYALRSALLSVWQENPQNSLGLHDKLRSQLRRIALRIAFSDSAQRAERTWNGLRAPETDPILDQAAQESPEMRRCLVLKYGCGLSVGKIARLTGVPASQLKTGFERFEVRCRRRLSPKERRHFDGRIAQSMEDWLLRVGPDMPESAALYRAFESEAAQMNVNSHRVSRFVGRILLFVLAVLCAFVFWLYAVLSQPAVLENPESPVSVTTEASIPNISP